MWSVKCVSVIAISIFIGCGDPDQTDIQPMDPGCHISAPRLETSSGLILEFTAPAQGIPRNELFSLDVTVHNSESPERLSILVDATMPAHGHGMLTMVDIVARDTPGTFTVSQMNLHMPGEWELSALIIDGENAEQVRTYVQCVEG